MSRGRTRGEAVIGWVETWCTTPAGAPARLTPQERAVLYWLYDGLQPVTEPVAGRLAAYIALLHLWARSSDVRPHLEVDLFTVWSACSPA
jgi:hypothetical protein